MGTSEQDWYTKKFVNEYVDARAEYLRLCELFKDVCWYNFETHCSKWKPPWRATLSSTRVIMCGMVMYSWYNKGKKRESGYFPVYYDGPVHDAPELPPEVVLIELRAAKQYMHSCEKQINAAHDWAPGGNMYMTLARTTLVGKNLE